MTGLDRTDRYETEMRRWNIAHFLLGRCNPDSANGVDKTVYYLARQQAAAGHAVRVLSVTPKPEIPIPGATVRNYAPLVGRVAGLPNVAQDILVDRASWNLPPQLASDILSDPPDIVHFHHTRVPQATRLGRRLRRQGIPYCVTLHGALSSRAGQRRRTMKMAYFRLVERRYLEGAAFLHALSGLDADGARGLGLQTPMVVIPNGVQVDGGVPDDTVPLASLIPQLAGRRVALFLGRLDPEQKGLDVLLEAVSRVDGIAVVLVGPTFRDGRRRLEALAKALEIDDRTVFMGPMHGMEKVRALAGADVFVYPSRWDGLPLAPLEAAAVGLPSVLSPASDPTGWLSDSGGAFVSDVEAESLAAVLGQVAAMTREALVEMGERARRCTVERFNWTTIAARIVEAYGDHCLPR